jgi:diguanylate cyclase (GGDEF)-like protein
VTESSIDSIPELVQLRRRAGVFFVWLLWAHVPIVILVTLQYRSGLAAPAVIATLLAASATLAVHYRPVAFLTRAVIAVALTGMPILFVFSARGPWQIDYHMYFFAVFAMLTAFCDWRPIAIAAALTSVHHLLFDAVDPSAVFPSEGGIGRVLLHATVVCVECGVLLWIIEQLRMLFRSAALARKLAEVRLADSEREATTRARNKELEGAVAEAKRTEAHLIATAFHDDLTGLRSRSYFMDALATALERSKKSPAYRYAVLFLDLDRFKLVNDSLGHRIGDLLLIGIAQRLRESVRPEDTIARLGGDEFTLLVDVDDTAQAIAVAERIEQALRAPLALGGTEVFCSASIGLAVNTAAGESPDELLRYADSAMYEAKRLSGGRGGFAVFKEEMHANAAIALQLQNDLRRALEREEFCLYYQPIVRLSTERVIGFEALVRWNHPERGLLSPGHFISAAEETGLIIGIGAWVLREACRQMCLWESEFGTDRLSIMSVNVSGRQLTQRSFYSDLERVLRETGAEPHRIQLEITESVLLDNSDFVGATLLRLRNLGIRIAFDDFGTGYSSLSYLQRYPVDALKIDQSFVRGIDGRSSNSEIIKTIVALGDTLSMRVVAEGVETAEQLHVVRALGCSSAQGYYFAKPMPSSQVAEFLGIDELRLLARTGA